jgi:sigma-B regulation protein RsbU (phosphoserine phosphatase)
MSDLAQQLGDLDTLLLFQGLPRETVLTALHGSSVLTLPAGSALLQPGDSNSSMYILLAGELAAHLDARNQEGTAIQILAGECVGELSALDGKPTSALVLAVNDVTLLELPGAIFRNQVLPLPGVAGNLLLALAERMRKANTAALRTQREQLELQHLRKELLVARQLQIDMVPLLQSPLFPTRGDIDACGFMEPASKVGGDLFDCFFVDRQHLFFCIGDVSGQGMAAALFMSRVVSVLRILALEYSMDPSGLLSAVNSRLYEGNEANVFVALFCGYLHVGTGHLRYSNAGHYAPLLAWHGGSKKIPVPKGALLGAIAGMSYLNCDITLAPGDLVLCHSDGLTDATNHAGEEFGEQRLADLLTWLWQKPLPELLAGIRNGVNAFMATALPEDDYTMLALRRVPEPKPETRPAGTATIAHFPSKR